MHGHHLDNIVNYNVWFPYEFIKRNQFVEHIILSEKHRVLQIYTDCIYIF